MVLGLAAAGGHLLAVLVLAPITRLSRRRLSVPVSVGILVTGQGGLYLALTLCQERAFTAAGGLAGDNLYQALTSPACASLDRSHYRPGSAGYRVNGNDRGPRSEYHLPTISVSHSRKLSTERNCA